MKNTTAYNSGNRMVLVMALLIPFPSSQQMANQFPPTSLIHVFVFLCTYSAFFSSFFPNFFSYSLTLFSLFFFILWPSLLGENNMFLNLNIIPVITNHLSLYYFWFTGIWQPTVPRWEKMFCSSVGSVPWEKLVETKKYMYLYDNVVNWNDSASEEAFDNAKSRFWSEINGLPCDIPLPDPDIYIDDIDWSSTIDPELILDLERDAIVPSDKENDAEVVIIGDALLVNQSFFCIGIAIKYTKI
uniref:Uncharacterized protein LOC113783901 isoform X1 n=1 Tax=Cicer arietinum TaxID=3827 RepID=A0A3Q7WZC9_CICAR|nr:uncharacterized protein LOC113783901 isoform X1 [Cicer arietinum]